MEIKNDSLHILPLAIIISLFSVTSQAKISQDYQTYILPTYSGEALLPAVR